MAAGHFLIIKVKYPSGRKIKRDPTLFLSAHLTISKKAKNRKSHKTINQTNKILFPRTTRNIMKLGFGSFLSTTMAVAGLLAIPTASADHLFTMTNAEDGNEVLMYKRDPNLGVISFVGAFATGKFFPVTERGNTNTFLVMYQCLVRGVSFFYSNC